MRRTNLTRAGALAAVGALALSACGSSSKSSTPPSGGGTKPVVKIGVQGPLSGPNAALGINEDWGVKLAVKQANDKGDLPFTLQVLDSDDQGLQASGADAARKLIQDGAVMGVIGPAFSGPTQAAGGLYATAGLTAISPSATNVALTSSGFTSFFRVVPPDSAQGTSAADYLAKAVKATKVYLVDDKTDYGVGLAGNVKDQLVKDGVAVVTDSVAQGTSDYSQIAGKVQSSGAQGMFYAGYYADGGVFAKALLQSGYKGTMMSGDGSKDPQFLATAGPQAVANWKFTCPCLDPTVDPKFSGFVTSYTALANAAPGTYSVEAYDATNALISVLKTGGTGNTRASVLAGVRTVDSQGLSKQVKFQPNGEVQGTTIYVYEFKNGKLALDGTVASLTGG
jgi:branched-chain amino acid transport system substrate-binding protein